MPAYTTWVVYMDDKGTFVDLSRVEDGSGVVAVKQRTPHGEVLVGTTDEEKEEWSMDDLSLEVLQLCFCEPNPVWRGVQVTKMTPAPEDMAHDQTGVVYTLNWSVPPTISWVDTCDDKTKYSVGVYVYWNREVYQVLATEVEGAFDWDKEYSVPHPAPSGVYAEWEGDGQISYDAGKTWHSRTPHPTSQKYHLFPGTLLMKKVQEHTGPVRTELFMWRGLAVHLPECGDDDIPDDVSSVVFVDGDGVFSGLEQVHAEAGYLAVFQENPLKKRALMGLSRKKKKGSWKLNKITLEMLDLTFREPLPVWRGITIPPMKKVSEELLDEMNLVLVIQTLNWNKAPPMQEAKNEVIPGINSNKIGVFVWWCGEYHQVIVLDLARKFVWDDDFSVPFKKPTGLYRFWNGTGLFSYDEGVTWYGQGTERFHLIPGTLLVERTDAECDDPFLRWKRQRMVSEDEKFNQGYDYFLGNLTSQEKFMISVRFLEECELHTIMQNAQRIMSIAKNAERKGMGW